MPEYCRILEILQISWHFFWHSPGKRAFFAPAFGICR
jgi:hypothetical protein